MERSSCRQDLSTKQFCDSALLMQQETPTIRESSLRKAPEGRIVHRETSKFAQILPLLERLRGHAPRYAGILEQQIANNALPLAVQYLSTVSKEREIWEAYASKRDILFQHHYPDAGPLSFSI